MQEQIRLLVELQELDTEIIARAKKIKKIPLKISSMERPLKDSDASLEAEKKKLQATEKKKKDRELELQANEDRIGKLKDRTAGIKDNKAYQAHLKEIETVERTSRGIEDVILEHMEELEERSMEVATAEEALAGRKQEAEKLRKELEAEVREAEKELDAFKARRPRYTGSLERENYDAYMQLLRAHDGLAVTEARDEVCTGCSMTIMPQLFVEIKKNDLIFQCPQCKRFLYHREEEAPAEQAG